MQIKINKRLFTESMRYWRNDLSGKPFLFDYIMAVWNKDSRRAYEFINAEPNIKQAVLDYLSQIAGTQPNPEILFILLSRLINP